MVIVAPGVRTATPRPKIGVVMVITLVVANVSVPRIWVNVWVVVYSVAVVDVVVKSVDVVTSVSVWVSVSVNTLVASSVLTWTEVVSDGEVTQLVTVEMYSVVVLSG